MYNNWCLIGEPNWALDPACLISTLSIDWSSSEDALTSYRTIESTSHIKSKLTIRSTYHFYNILSDNKIVHAERPKRSSSISNHPFPHTKRKILLRGSALESPELNHLSRLLCTRKKIVRNKREVRRRARVLSRYRRSATQKSRDRVPPSSHTEVVG